MASPLILGNDPRKISKRALELLTAKEVVAVNQDPLGLQAARIQRGDNELWIKGMADGSVVVLLVNRAGHKLTLSKFIINFTYHWYVFIVNTSNFIHKKSGLYLINLAIQNM